MPRCNLIISEVPKVEVVHGHTEIDPLLLLVFVLIVQLALNNCYELCRVVVLRV